MSVWKGVATRACMGVVGVVVVMILHNGLQTPRVPDTV